MTPHALLSRAVLCFLPRISPNPSDASLTQVDSLPLVQQRAWHSINPLRPPRQTSGSARRLSTRSEHRNIMVDFTPFTESELGDYWTRPSSTSRPCSDRKSWAHDVPSPWSKVAYTRIERTNYRHEPSGSLSSISSSSSAPGLTYASDSDASADEDSQYNISTSQLWDSFWQSIDAKSNLKSDQKPSKIQPAQSDDYFTLSVLNHYTQDGDDDNNGESHIIDIPAPEREPPAVPLPLLRRTTSSRQSRRCAVRPTSPRVHARTYSIFPEQQPPPPPPRQLPALPPRTSSLASPTLPSAPPLPPTRAQKVNGLLSVLRPSRSIHNLRAAHSDPLDAALPPLPLTSHSAPTSPGLPKPMSLALRSSRSAFNLRAKAERCPKMPSQHNFAAPLAPLSPPPVPLCERPLPALPVSSRPPANRFVSVFELDSDCESDVESSSGLAKRIARGLHKKTPSGRRNVLPSRRPATADQDNAIPTEKELKEAENALARRRGGSLGRIFGLKYRF